MNHTREQQALLDDLQIVADRRAYFGVELLIRCTLIALLKELGLMVLQTFLQIDDDVLPRRGTSQYSFSRRYCGMLLEVYVNSRQVKPLACSTYHLTECLRGRVCHGKHGANS